jgi:hypothetical protein
MIIERKSLITTIRRNMIIKLISIQTTRISMMIEIIHLIITNLIMVTEEEVRVLILARVQVEVIQVVVGVVEVAEIREERDTVEVKIESTIDIIRVIIVAVEDQTLKIKE